jgi:hypothetical protein
MATSLPTMPPTLKMTCYGLIPVSEAKCDILLGSFLAHILEPGDIDLLQRYLSQVLEGINHSQNCIHNHEIERYLLN